MNRIAILIASLPLLLCSQPVESAAESVVQLQPVPRASILGEEGYIVWGASMVQDDNGTCHLFYCRWKGTLNTWCTGAEIVRAAATAPEGPYKIQEVVLTPTQDVDDWDGLSIFNPTVLRSGGKYYLYYSGSNGSNFPIPLEDGSFKRSPKGTLITQRIGVAVADHPAGPWKTAEKPLIDLSDDGFDSQMVCNPTVTQGGDGQFLMMYKCSNGRPGTRNGGIYLSVAFSDSPTGPFKKTGRKILTHPQSRFPVEDPFIWWQDGTYRAAVDDQRGSFSGKKGLILFESEDGLDWTPSTPFVLSRCQIVWEDGEIEKTHHFERPQIWLKDGKPAMLFAAIARGDSHFNVHVPLRSIEVAPPQENASKPNIILVMADDQGWGDTGYNGHPFVQTPALDAMAADGFVFDRFYAAAPVCSPTRASVMTGRNPIRTKVPNHGRYMRQEEITLAETLRKNGYATGMFGKLHLGSGQPESPANPSAMGFDEWVIGLNFFDNDPYLSRNGQVEHRQGKGSVLVMDDALAFLEKHQDGDQPLFAVIWFPSPHDPHVELPAGPSLYDNKTHAGYYREITLLDQQVGRLRQELKRMDIAENTLVWYCSDNGGLVPETSGGREKKGSIYEGGLRVPAIIEWPAKELKGRSSLPTCTFDMYPTLLAMAGIHNDNPLPLDGLDISGVFEGSLATRPRPMGFWHQFQGGQSTWSDRLLKEIMEKQQAGAPRPHLPERMQKDMAEFPQFDEGATTGHAAWIDWPWKLHRINGKTLELYNLAHDPMETTDCSARPEHQQRLERMKKELDLWMRSVVQSINGKEYDLLR
jgi:arylsulfatase A-like enzyme